MSNARSLNFAFAGWVVSALAAVLVGFTWPAIFPAVVVVEHYYGSGPTLPAIIFSSVLVTLPGGLLGGIIGSRIPKEGGVREQYYMAGIMGVLFSLPFACMVLWFFTGW